MGDPAVALSKEIALYEECIAAIEASTLSAEDKERWKTRATERFMLRLLAPFVLWGGITLAVCLLLFFIDWVLPTE